MRLILLLFLIPSATLSQRDLKFPHGTSILAYIKPDTIWIASDTRVTRKDSTHYKDRKIRQTNNVFYAFSELPVVLTKDDQVVISAFETMNNAIQKGKDFGSTFEIFNESIIKQWNALISQLAKFNDLADMQMYRKKYFLQCLMVAFENGHSVYKVRRYKFDEHAFDLKIVYNDDAVPKNITPLFGLGSYQNAYKFIKENNYLMRSTHRMIEQMVLLINVEAKANPIFVGMPADVVIIYKDGHKWFYDQTLKGKQ